MSFMGTYFGPGLLHQGQLYWDNLMGARRVNNAQRARDVKYLLRHILCIPWFTGETNGGHCSLIVQSKSTHSKAAFYNMDSLNRFNNNASYTLSKTTLCLQKRDSWYNVRTVRHMELECGMILCLAASMIAQYKGTIPKRVKSCMEIENLAIFAREYVVDILTAKKWTGIDNQN
jgi:hypothetical protein